MFVFSFNLIYLVYYHGFETKKKDLNVKKRSMIGEKEEAKMVVRGGRRCRSYKGTWYIKTIIMVIL